MTKRTLLAMLFSFLTACPWLSAAGADGRHEIQLPGSNIERYLPVMAVDGTKLFIAYRAAKSFGRSDTLEVSCYDLTNYLQISHVTVRIPAVRGTRAAGGLYIVGRRIFYAELRTPAILVSLSAQDLSEVGRTENLPFEKGDWEIRFVGPDSNGLLAFAEFLHGGSGDGGVRILRVNPRDLRVVSNKTVPELGKKGIQNILWSVRSGGKLWIDSDGQRWNEYTEEGQPTNREVFNVHYVTNGAEAIEGGGLLAFYGNKQEGMLLRQDGQKGGELPLGCSPIPWGISNSGSFAGVMCVKQSTRRFEDGGNRVISSEFLLVRTSVPAIVWRRGLSFLDVDEGWHLGHQDGVPAIATCGSRVWVITPAQPSRLDVYEVDWPE